MVTWLILTSAALVLSRSSADCFKNIQLTSQHMVVISILAQLNKKGQVTLCFLCKYVSWQGLKFQCLLSFSSSSPGLLAEIPSKQRNTEYMINTGNHSLGGLQVFLITELSEKGIPLFFQDQVVFEFLIVGALAISPQKGVRLGQGLSLNLKLAEIIAFLGLL